MASGHSVPVSIRSQATQVSAITYATERLGITVIVSFEYAQFLKYIYLQDDTCFLLLDLREPDEFMQYHIKECKIIWGLTIKYLMETLNINAKVVM